MRSESDILPERWDQLTDFPPNANPMLCAHCGRVMGDYAGGSATAKGERVCHPNDPDRPQCYDLVTRFWHPLRCRQCWAAAVHCPEAICSSVAYMYPGTSSSTVVLKCDLGHEYEVHRSQIEPVVPYWPVKETR